jgi:hypothetical protein
VEEFFAAILVELAAVVVRWLLGTVLPAGSARES